MERAAWTDERLDDLAEAIRFGFHRLDQDLREVRGEIRDVRGEFRGEFRDVRGEIEALRQTMLRIGGGMLVGFISVIGAILARGA